MDSLETALHAIDTMLAAMDKADVAMKQVLTDHADLMRLVEHELYELREQDAALSNRIEALTQAGLHSVKA